jgi:uncharacterized protein
MSKRLRSRIPRFQLTRIISAIAAVAIAVAFSPVASAQLPDGYVRAQKAFDQGDLETAITLLEPLAKGGDTAARTLLGYAYIKRKATPTDVAKAMALFRQAAADGSASAQFFLGFTYHNGHHGFAQDYGEAAKWAILAARQGVAESQGVIGYYYNNGYGSLPKDPAIAACWFRRGANQGNAFSQFNLGRVTSIGLGVPEDYVEAYKWLNLAAAQGIEPAISLRDTLRPLLTSAQLAEAQRASTNWRSVEEELGSTRESCS